MATSSLSVHILLHIRGLFELLFRLDDQLTKPRTTLHPWRLTQLLLQPRLRLYSAARRDSRRRVQLLRFRSSAHVLNARMGVMYQSERLSLAVNDARPLLAGGSGC